MTKYFEVVVQIRMESEDSRGNVKVKRMNENYLVDAMSVTEAEARVVELFKLFSQEFEVVQVKSSKIIEVVTVDSKPKPKPDPILNNSNQLAKDKDDFDEKEEDDMTEPHL